MEDVGGYLRSAARKDSNVEVNVERLMRCRRSGRSMKKGKEYQDVSKQDDERS